MKIKDFIAKSTKWSGKSLTELTADQQAELMAEFTDHLAEGSISTKAELQKFKELADKQAAELLEQKEAAEKLEAAMKKQGEFLATLEKGKEANKQGFKLDKEDIATLEAICKAQKSGEKKTFRLKATVLPSSVTNSTVAQRDSRVALAGIQMLTMTDVMNSRPLGRNEGGSIRYIDVDEASLVRAAAAVAAGATIPEDTIVWAENSKTLSKIAGIVPYDETFENDFNFLMQSLQQTLMQSVELELDNQLVNGNNVAPQLDGIINQVPAYVPVASGVTDPQLVDLVRHMRNDIMGPNGNKFKVDTLIMNSDDIIAEFASGKKDADNNYIRIIEFINEMGIRVVENNNVATNTLYLGDSNYLYYLNAGGFEVETGYNGNDFGEYQKSLRIVARANALLREGDSEGWLRCTDISAALSTLAT